MTGIIFALALPTMLEQLMHTAVQYIDTAMVGTLGTEATAAVGATSTVNWLVGSTVSALGVGFLSYIAKKRGEGDHEGARACAAQVSLAVLTVGAFFTLLTLSLSGAIPRWMQVDESIRELSSLYFFIIYLPMLPRCASILFGTVLRAAGETKIPMKIGIGVNLINLLLNFLLIYPTRSVTVLGISLTLPGAGKGVVGAAIATAVSYTLGGILTTVAVYRNKEISPKGKSMRPHSGILRPCLKVAMPNMLQRFGTSLGYVAFASMINSLGDVATAAHTIANTVESAFYIPGYGMQTAAATLAGNAYGAKDRERLKRLSSTIIPIELLLMVASGGLLLLGAEPLMSLFSKDEAVIALGATVLRMVAVSEPFYGFSIIVEGLMQGVGKTRVPFVFNVTGMWAVRILGTFLLITFASGTLISAWGCMIAHNMLLFLLFLITYLRGGHDPFKAPKKT